MRPRTTATLFVAAILAACGHRAEPESVAPSSGAVQATVDEVLPAVVYIQAIARPPTTPDLLEMVPPGDPRAPAPPRPHPQPPPWSGAGSGVLFTEDGYILTSSHVVQRADRVTVTLYDRRQFEAEVVAFDPSTDVAVVKIEGHDLPVAPLGDSDRVEVGEWVLALGSPLGLLFTATAGIVSAKGRAIGILNGEDDPRGASPLEDFLQTDAAINPGNSGGPLVNLAGEVIGINTAIASPTGLFTGAGFAIPINLARRVAADLIRYGYNRRPFLGVLLDDVEPVDVEYYHLPGPGGAEIVHVLEGSPAERAGLQLGDVIIAVGDRKVDSPAELQAALAELDPEVVAPLHIIRYGRELLAPVKLGLVRAGERPEPTPALDGEMPSRLGFVVAREPGRVVIAGVQPYSPAARAGVRPGQVIEAVNRREVKTVEEFADAVSAITGGIVSLIVIDPRIGRTILNYRLEP